MAIKGMSEDVVAAIEFDPFSALEQEGGGQQGQRPSRDQRQPAQAPQQPQAQPGGPDQKPDVRGRGTRDQQQQRAAPGIPGRDPSTGRYTPAAPPQMPGRQPAQAAPAQPEGGNTVAELMDRLRDSPAMFLAPASGQAAPDMGAPSPQQAPGGGAPSPQMQWGYDYSRPWAEQRVDLPAPLLEAIFHEDRNVAAQGMGVLVNTMYNAIMNDVHTRVAEVLRNAPIMSAGVADLTSSRAALKAKFYGKFSDLADPVGMQTVYTLAMNVANLYNQMGQQVDPMSDDFIDYVGAQARQMLGRVQQPAQPRRQYGTGGAGREIATNGNPFMEAIGMA